MDKQLSEEIKKQVDNISQEVVSLRRFFHQNPELGFEEYKTSEKIACVLRETGIQYEKVANTGITAFLKGRGRTTIGLRADMDALPVEEKTGLPFASVNKGIMHACGHDGHMAVVLGVAKVLKKLEQELRCNIKFIFQPSEERHPSGAVAMIRQRVLDNLNYILGFHFFPFMPIFSIWVGQGPVMANADVFSINITGKGGHGASPHLSNDPVVCSAYLITSLQSIVSRNIDPVKPCVLSVCKISAGTAYNVIPEQVTVQGTVRSLEDSVGQKIKSLMKSRVDNICHSFGCKADFTYNSYVPSCINDPLLSQKVKKAAHTILSPRDIIEYHPIMGSEDFAFFSRTKPSCYIFIGIGDTFGDNHNNRFSMDERVLPYTVNFFASLLMKLGTKNKEG